MSEAVSVPIGTSRLFVGNFPYSTTEQDLKDYFSEFGDVAEVVILQDRETQRSRGFGFVEMASAEQAEAVLEYEHQMGGRVLNLDRAKARPQSQRYQQRPSRHGR